MMGVVVVGARPVVSASVGKTGAVIGSAVVVIRGPTVVVGVAMVGNRRVVTGRRNLVIAAVVTSAIPAVVGVRVAGGKKACREKEAKDERESEEEGFHSTLRPTNWPYFNLSFEPSRFRGSRCPSAWH